jgi:hypothetical protein
MPERGKRNKKSTQELKEIEEKHFGTSSNDYD